MLVKNLAKYPAEIFINIYSRNWQVHHAGAL